MEKSGFFDAEESPSGEYDREYLAEDFASYFAQFISNGVFPNPSTGLQVVASEEPDMSVTLMPGYAYINGYKYENTAPLKFEVDVADGLMERDETIFIRFSRLDRNIKAYKIKGEPSVSAVTPEVVRTADYWDLCVAVIHVNAGIISIDQSLIEDTRLNTEVCGIVTTLIKQVDTTTLYKQIQADLKNFQTVSYQEFVDWFEDLKGKLGEEPATALQQQIDSIMDGTEVPESGISVYTHSKSGTTHEFTGSGPNGRAKMTADVAEGDTFTVNGEPVTAWMGVDEAAGAMAGSSYNGRWVSFIADGNTLNFKGGGGKITAEGLSADAIVAGNTVKIFQGAKEVQSITGTAKIKTVDCGNIVAGYIHPSTSIPSATKDISSFLSQVNLNKDDTDRYTVMVVPISVRSNYVAADATISYTSSYNKDTATVTFSVGYNSQQKHYVTAKIRLVYI